MHNIKVFYDARQVATNNPSFSPSAGKPALVVEEWKKRGYNFSLVSVTPLTRDQFYLAHDKSFVDGVLNLTQDNGFDNRSPEVAKALPWTSGSMYSASRDAYLNKEVNCSPTSGFHHAHYSFPEGYCTFNGLMATSILLRQEFPEIKIGILDLDHHYGNGTDDILRHFRIDYVHHYTFGGDNPDNWHWKGGEKAQSWLQQLPKIVAGFEDCDLVLYQAGADPHIDDPFGGALTNSQLRTRDRIVFRTLENMKKPIAWNLAGGYQDPIQKVLDIHNATIEECLAAYEKTY